MNVLSVQKRKDRDDRFRAEEERLEKYLKKNFGKKVASYTSQYAIDLMAMIVWSAAKYNEKWGKKKLLDFARQIQPGLTELVRHYEMDGSDTTFLCLRLLKQNKDITEEELCGLLNVECEVGVDDGAR